MTRDEQLTERHKVQAGEAIQRIRVSVAEGPDAPSSIELDPSSAIAIGTSADNTVVLTDPAVSRYHLELHRASGGVLVIDLGSSNGSYVGSLRVERGIAALPVRIAIGRSVLVLEDGEAVAARTIEGGAELPGIVGQSEAIRNVRAQIDRLAKTQSTVLVLGETGTGKELVARAIHDLGPRSDRPFVVVDCGSLAPTLIASELFGHEKGSFTGADERRTGAFERAHGGTIVLDEIGELPLAVQPSLLGVLERRRIRAVGSAVERSIDVRVISSTHRDLRAEVNAGNFRADLYFRLAVARMVIPPLRERTEDIPLLVEHFVREAVGGSGESPFGPATIDALMGHRWSGNVRELKNVVESALAMGQVSLEGDSSAGAGGRAGDAGLAPYKEARARAISDFERSYLARLIEACGGNASEAARRARMDRPYLLSLLRRHDLR